MTLDAGVGPLVGAGLRHGRVVDRDDLGEALVPAGALGLVWLATGLALGAVARRWARVAAEAALPSARARR